MRFTIGGCVMIMTGLAIGCGIAWWSGHPFSDPIAAMAVGALMTMPFFVAADLLAWVRARRRKNGRASRD